jgi:hypothetical protein
MPLNVVASLSRRFHEKVFMPTLFVGAASVATLRRPPAGAPAAPAPAVSLEKVRTVRPVESLNSIVTLVAGDLSQ